jgi:carbamoyltransferase
LPVLRFLQTRYACAMTNILGISALYHDAAACLVSDGQIVAAAQEERFSRIKHDPSFPKLAISYCLEEAGIGPEDLDAVTFYEKPLQRFDRLIETYLRVAPRGLRSFLRATGALVNDKLSVTGTIDKALEHRYDGPILYTTHHEAHAASAFLPSPFETAAIVTTDGVGEWTTTSIGRGEGPRISMLADVRFPHSLGLLYSAFTYYVGFRVNSGEYKLMGLAPYGEPRFAQAIRDELIELRPDGSFRLNLDYFAYQHGLSMINERFSRLFGRPPRPPETPMDRHHADVAASIQVVIEEAMMGLAREAHERTGESNLCLAGGVALNCVANGRLLREGPFERIWIQPAAGDAGGALGAALFTWHQLHGEDRKPDPLGLQRGSLLGPAFGDEEVRSFLDGIGAKYEIKEDAEVDRWAVDALKSQKVVGWFQGRMEYGPRALGSRTILGDPREPEMQSRINMKIKFREGFRPFAPVVLKERAADYFDLEVESPYMLLVAQVAASQRLEVDGDEPEGVGLDRLHRKRSTIPAVTHVDGSARIQTCDSERHTRLHSLIRAWEAETGCPLLLNTSFNVRGEPIVCTPEDAYRCFMTTEMDALVMGRVVLDKAEQPRYTGPAAETRPD